MSAIACTQPLAAASTTYVPAEVCFGSACCVSLVSADRLYDSAPLLYAVHDTVWAVMLVVVFSVPL